VLTIVVVADQLRGLRPAHDSTVAIMEEVQALGHRLLVTTPEQLGVRNSRAVARCAPVHLRPGELVNGTWKVATDWWQAESPQNIALDDADAVLMRADPPVDANYLRATYLLDQIDPRRTLLLNAPHGLRETSEKLFTLRFPALIPDTVVSADPVELADLARAWGRAVLKPTDAMAGRGVLLLRSDDLNLHSLLHTATGYGRRHVVAQRWVDTRSGDRRVIVLDAEPVGVVRRLAAPGDFRCNMAAGANVVADTVTTLDKKICSALAPELRRLGIMLAGLDVIGDRLIEVNITSPTGLREIDALTGSRLARLVVERIEDRCAQMRDGAAPAS